MDKETAVEIERLKSHVGAHDLRLLSLEKDREEWKTMVKKTVHRVVKYLLTLGAAGITFGLSMPENLRKWLIRVLSE